MQLLRKPVASLSPLEWDELWQFSDRYTDSSRETLERGLRAKQTVALARDGGELVGMAAIDIAAVCFEGRTVVRIFTASTLVREDKRGQNLIQRWALPEVVAAKLRWPFAPTYWFFDTFSYRSYLLLPRNFRDYWPRWDRPTPPHLSRLLDALARPIYGADWDPDQGLARGNGLKKLKAFVAPIDEAARRDPHVRFFGERNPGYAAGDRLVCLAPLDLRNGSVVTARSLARALRKRRSPAPA